MSIARLIRQIDDVSVPRPERLVAETFDIFTLWPDGRLSRWGHRSFDTLQEAIDARCGTAAHKDRFVVGRRDAETGAVTLGVYLVRQRATPRYVPDPATFTTKRILPLYAEHLHDLRLEGLLP